jgi:hypothetical protein
MEVKSANLPFVLTIPKNQMACKWDAVAEGRSQTRISDTPSVTKTGLRLKSDSQSMQEHTSKLEEFVIANPRSRKQSSAGSKHIQDAGLRQFKSSAHRNPQMRIREHEFVNADA